MASPVNQRNISVAEAQVRGFILSHPIAITGPQDKMTDGNIDAVIEVVAAFFLARQSLANRQEALDKQAADVTADPENPYTAMAKRALTQFQASMAALQHTYQTTGLSAHH